MRQGIEARQGGDALAVRAQHDSPEGGRQKKVVATDLL